MNWIDYLIELRRRTIFCLIILVMFFSLFFIFAKQSFTYIALPLITQLPHGGKIVTTTVIGPFLVPVKLSLLLAILAGMPFLLYQLWAFVTPALYQQERKVFFYLLLGSIFLFYLGVSFAYLLFLPL